MLLSIFKEESYVGLPAQSDVQVPIEVTTHLSLEAKCLCSCSNFTIPPTNPDGISVYRCPRMGKACLTR